MPRPVLARLGVHYRRIPVLALGRDIYCDSRCIIDTLECLYSDAPRLGADPKKVPWQHGVEKMLESWALEWAFMRTAALITPDAKLVQDQAWLDDREQLTGRRFSEDAMREYLPDALAAARIHLDLVEGMLDGREWIGGGEEPGLADVHLGWVFDWMLRGPEEMGMRWAYPEVLHEKKYLRVFGWIERLNRVVAEKRKEQGELKVLKDDEAVSMVEQARWFEGEELEMLEWDPTGLKRGNEVDLYATDVLNGWQNRDTGELVGLRADRVSVRTNTKNGVDVRIHYPRINIRITKAESKL